MPARKFEGKVISNKMTKTLVVAVARQYQEHRTGKIVHRKTKYKVHSTDAEVAEGDLVSFSECRPMSKDKRFRLLSVLKRSQKALETAEGVA